MHEATKSLIAATSDVPSSATETATFVRFDGPMCVVTDGLGVEQSYRWAGTVIPAPGDSVQVQNSGGKHVVLGRTLPTPTQGTVKAVSATTLVIDVAVGPSPIEAAFTYPNPAIGDKVALTYGFEGFLATGRTSFSPPPPPPSPPPPAVTQTYRHVFRALQAGNWFHGRWEDGRPIVSDGRNGGYHYGTVLGATLPDAAEIVAGRIYLPTEQVLFPLAPGIQALDAPPPVSDGVGPAGVLGARSGWVDIDRGILEQLRIGNRGIKLYRRPDPVNGTWDIYKSLASDPMSGALEITWRA